MGNTLSQYCINVSDLERSEKFYEEVLGLEVKQRIQIEGVDEVILGGDTGTHIQLAHQHAQKGPIDHGNAFWKLYLYTEDCQDVYDRAVAAGSESVRAPARLDRWPVTAAFIKDPDGYEIEILQRHDD